MKIWSRLLFFILVVSIVMQLSGCDESNGGNRSGTILDKTAATRR